MSKNEELGIGEYRNYSINPHVLNVIHDYQNQHQLKNEEIKILDFGCGRGRSVLKLKLEGYDAVGVDIDRQPIENATSVFQHFGFKSDEYLFEIEEDCRLPFADTYFDIVFSEQVVEHIKNIEVFFGGIANKIKTGGISFHAFPYKYHVTEQHLYMPIIHWLPKNILRKLAIMFWLRFGRDPNWQELSKYNTIQKAEKYYSYSINKTYYRSNKFLEKLNKKAGFQVSMNNLGYNFKFNHYNSYFPHTTHIVAVKSN